MVINSILRTLINIFDDDLTLHFKTELDTFANHNKKLCYWLLWKFCNHGN